jgi:hypothetical protein
VTDERLRKMTTCRRRNLVPDFFEFAFDVLLHERLGCSVAVVCATAIALSTTRTLHASSATRRLDTLFAIQGDDARLFDLERTV